MSVSSHSTTAINYARSAASKPTAEQKLNDLAKAIEAIAWAIRDLDKKS
jgi:hypothetical protein